MADTTKANILIIAPELSTVPDPTFTLILADVILMVTLDKFGDFEERAQRYLAAHLLTVSAAGGAVPAGPIIEEEVGKERNKYAKPVVLKDNSRYDSTSYGREYMSIRRACVVGMVTVTPDG